MTGDKKWFSSLTPLSHKEYVTFGDDKKGKVLGTGVIKVNDFFTLNDVTLVDKLRYNLLSVSQLLDADLDVLFHKSDSYVLNSSGKHVCGISRIGNVFKADLDVYNLLSVSQLVDADLDVLFHNSDSYVLDSSGKHVCGISRIGNVFQADFPFAQSSMKCLISRSSSKLWK
jgi:hypothetical protein